MTAKGNWPFTHRQFGKDGRGRTTQLDYIVAPKRALDQAYIHYDVLLWHARDHFPIYATIQEDDVKTDCTQKKKKKKWAGWRPLSDEPKLSTKML